MAHMLAPTTSGRPTTRPKSALWSMGQSRWSIYAGGYSPWQMRILAVGLVLAVAGVGAAAVADLTVPFATIGHGSYSRAPVAEGLELLPPQPCGAPSASPCPARFAYAPNQKLTVWFSVRNESRVPLTLDGLPRGWFEQFPSELLMRPVAVLDGGGPVRGSPGAMDAAPFQPLVLAPLEERMVGLEFRTTADVAYACTHWMAGTGDPDRSRETHHVDGSERNGLLWLETAVHRV